MAASLTAPDGHKIILSGTLGDHNQEFIQKSFKSIFKNQLGILQGKEISNEDSPTILVVGKQPKAELVQQAINIGATLVTPKWLDEVHKAKAWIAPTVEHMWKQDAGQSENGAPPANSGGAPPTNSDGAPPTNSDGAPPTNSDGAPPANSGGAPPANSDGAPPTNSGGAPPTNSDGAPDGTLLANPAGNLAYGRAGSEAPSMAPTEEIPYNGPRGQTQEITEGPNINEKDYFRRMWLNQVRGGPWVVSLDEHPRDSSKKNYIMRVEGMYSNWFVVTDPMAPTFRLHPQLRDAYLIPLRDHAALREKYTQKGGNSFLKRSATSLRIKNGEIFQFNFWGVAFDGRVCIVIGNLPNDSRPGAWTRTDFKTAHGTDGLNLLDSIRECFDHPKMDRYTGKHRIRAAEVKAIQLELEERGPPVALETQMESETAALQRQIRPLDMRYELRSGRYQPPHLKAAYESEGMESQPSAPDTALRALGAPLTANVLAAGIRNVLDKHQSSEESAAVVQQVEFSQAKQYELISDALTNLTADQFYEFMKRGHQELGFKLGLLQTTQSSPNAPAIQSSGAPVIQVSGAPANQSPGTVMDTTE